MFHLLFHLKWEGPRTPISPTRRRSRDGERSSLGLLCTENSEVKDVCGFPRMQGRDMPSSQADPETPKAPDRAWLEEGWMWLKTHTQGWRKSLWAASSWKNNFRGSGKLSLKSLCCHKSWHWCMITLSCGYITGSLWFKVFFSLAVPGWPKSMRCLGLGCERYLKRGCKKNCQVQVWSPPASGWLCPNPCCPESIHHLPPGYTDSSCSTGASSNGSEPRRAIFMAQQ